MANDVVTDRVVQHGKNMFENIAIVGSGQSGVSVAFKLRTLGFEGRITLIGQEPDPPYQRPPLSKKYIARLAEEERLYLKQSAIYESERIELILGSQVVAIHRSEKQLELCGGNRIDYDALVLTTGARARTLPEEHGGRATNVYTLRTLSDAKLLRAEFTEGRSLLVIGGGYIGLETAAVARSLGMQVTLIEREDRILARVASGPTAEYFRQLHAHNGVRVMEAVGIERLDLVDNRATHALLTDGTQMPVDLVVVGIGVVPETELARAAGLTVANGIVVDEAGRTSDTSIYAAGDCACFTYRDERIRLESVQNAVDMAETVAHSILGQEVAYQCFPWFWSDQYSSKLQIAGLNLGYTHVAERRSNSASMSVWYYNQEQFIAVDAINDAKAFMLAKRWLAKGLNPARSSIADTGIELEACLVGQNEFIS